MQLPTTITTEGTILMKKCMNNSSDTMIIKEINSKKDKLVQQQEAEKNICLKQLRKGLRCQGLVQSRVRRKKMDKLCQIILR